MWQMKIEVIPTVIGALGTEWDGRKLQESIRESYCDGDPKDLHAGICTKNPREGGLVYERTR